jgi:pantoate kinase
MPNLYLVAPLAVSIRLAHVAGRSTAPVGTSPVVTKRHRAISSLRARATIMVLRRPGLAPFVRASNHSAKALAFGT